MDPHAALEPVRSAMTTTQKTQRWRNGLWVPGVAVIAVLASRAWLLTQQSASGWGEGWGMGSSGSTHSIRDDDGMMGNYRSSSESAAPVDNLSQARDRAAEYAQVLQSGLEVGEVMRFENHYYADLQEPDGTKITEVLIDPRSGAVRPEMSPAVMWNTGFGMTGQRPGSDTEMTAKRAQEIADRWLAEEDGGLSRGIPPTSPVTTRCTPRKTARSSGCSRCTPAPVMCGITPGTVISWRCRSTRQQCVPLARPQ